MTTNTSPRNFVIIKVIKRVPVKTQAHKFFYWILCFATLMAPKQQRRVHYFLWNAYTFDALCLFLNLTLNVDYHITEDGIPYAILENVYSSNWQYLHL
jgi:hypothetical protein